MPELPDALRYARAGMAIIPVFTVDASGRCQCGSEHKRDPKSIGKHPVTANGVSDATRRGTTIEGWFRIQYNIGIACGMVSRGLAVVDIDDRDVAKAIVDYFAAHPEVERPPISSTTRGIHLWFICPGEVNRKLRRSTGTHLGEIRCDGQYVIGPPSATVANGAPRRFWRADPDLIPEPMGVESVLDWLIALLSAIGVALAPIKDKVTLADMPGDIEEVELPFKPRKTVLKNIISGNYPTDDRSGVIFRLVRELKEQAERDGYDLSTAQLAGIAKKIDRAHYHKYDGTFDGRTDGDLRYWEVASNGGQQEDATGAPQTATGPSRQGQRYLWSDEGGVGSLTFVEGKRELSVANFRPELVKVLNVLQAGTSQAVSSYVLRVRRSDDDTREITLTEKDLNADALPKAIHSQLRHWGYVLPRGWGHIWPAAQEFGRSPAIEDAYGDLGWNRTPDGEDVFLLPNAEGGLTADGINPAIKFFGFPNEHAAGVFKSYGQGVRPANGRAEHRLLPIMLQELFACTPPHVLMPVLAAVFGAPLLSLGLRAAPPLVHLVGLTGQGKTTVSAAVLSVFGDFYTSWKPTIPASWLRSTINGLSIPLHMARDLPLLVDDYKEDKRKAQGITELIHGYAEGTTALRMRRDQSAGASLDPRGLLLSTGQDTWDTQESVAGRTLNITVAKDEVSKEHLTAVLERVQRGEFQLLGGTYLRWLARTGSEQVSDHIRSWLREERAAINIPLHDHLLSMIAALRVSERMVQAWLTEDVPAIADAFAAERAANAEMLTRQLFDEVQRAKTLAPAQSLIDFVGLHIIAESVRLVNRKERSSLDRYLNGAARDVIGFFDDEYIYLTKDLTYSWYSARLRSQGADATSSWDQICADASQSLGLSTSYQMSWANKRRALQVPLELIGDAQTVRMMLRKVLEDDS